MITARKLMFVALLLVSSVASFAQTHWTCNPKDFQYDMTAYFTISISNQEIDPTTVELAAFVGNECRGVAEAQEVKGHKFYYLRIRSNTISGEKISFKAYKDGIEYVIDPNDPIIFESMKMIGLPSSPVSLESTVIPGDANGDGKVSVADITIIVQQLLGRNPANIVIAGADANGDGKVSVNDITTVVRIILKK